MEDYDKPLRSRTMSVESGTGPAAAAGTAQPQRAVASSTDN